MVYCEGCVLRCVNCSSAVRACLSGEAPLNLAAESEQMTGGGGYVVSRGLSRIGLGHTPHRWEGRKEAEEMK